LGIHHRKEKIGYNQLNNMAIKKVYKKNTEIHLPISKHIDVNFRSYALYVLENRGIPSFYDGLTNVQKFILQNSPTTFTKTVSVIGKCIEAGYHHGDKSLGGAINKLARPSGCADMLLNGSGFFGNAISNEAAAPRYTSVKIDKNVAEIIKKNNFLNTKNEDGQWDPLWMEVPVGLSTMIIGIAVGYATTVLPRSIEDMQKFINGEIKEIHPKFVGFNGKISRFNGMQRSWLIEGVVKVDPKTRTVNVSELPPLLKYSSFLKKIDRILENYDSKVDVKNKTRDKIDLQFIFKPRDENEFNTFADRIIKATKMIVTETPVFVKDGVVLVYDSVEDYLTDFKYRLSDLKARRAKHFLNVTSDELDFQKAKKLFLEFMLAKKRNDSEVDGFLEQFSSYISRRLDAISLRKLTSEEIKRTEAKIKELEKEKTKLEKEYQKLQKDFDKLVDPTTKRGTVNKQMSSFDLFDETDFDEYDGIQVFKGPGEEEEDEDEEDED
jgi:topoisomerase-4 subunit A